ncbi:MAG: hypothetical protein EOO13_07415 [Chitinophagaceae bacterium]|nr:MAG: hypothetical protein EOO13_07415 [Chitinophagaceae bacterium]
MIAVFRTNVNRKKDADKLIRHLLVHYPDGRINFDLQDCDKILRVDTEVSHPQKIINLINEHGFSCNELE